ncbi:MAG: hypothetical protein ABI067_01035 [Leifsonia sp.]
MDLVFCAAAIGLIVSWNPWLLLVALILEILAVLAILVLVLAASWVIYDKRTRYRVYMNPGRSAVIILEAKNNRWELKNHLVQHVGRGHGANLRNLMATPLRAAANAASVSLYGKAANEKVQRIYLTHFASWGLRAKGKKEVIWP